MRHRILAPKSAEWEKILEAAKKEGQVVVSIPTSAELRKEFETGFQKAYPGIELELNVARGASNINKIAEEQNAGVRSIDLHIGGTTSIITGLLAPNFLEPVMPSMILPEVRDPKHWWGGHIWADNAKRYVYSFTAYMTETIWYNTTLVKPEEINSWDSCWIRSGREKSSSWTRVRRARGNRTGLFCSRIKGEQFLAKLAAQEMTVGRNLRQLGEQVARGKSAISIGVSYYTYLPFIKAGLPVKSISNIKEGYYAGTGSGNLAVLKNQAIPMPPRFLSTGCFPRKGRLR